MNIQSLSVVVPNKNCINKCEFCVARMNESSKCYKNQMDENLPFYDLYIDDYLKRLEFARDNGCNTLMLTGDSEPQQNRAFLKDFGLILRQMKNPFKNIEMQTTGALLDKNYLRFLRNFVQVSTISLSTSSFNEDHNNEIIHSPVRINYGSLCEEIKLYDFNLRLSLNMSSEFNDLSLDDIYEKANNLGANQVTFRILYTSGTDTPQDKWIASHPCNKSGEDITKYVESRGTFLEILPFGAKKYSVNGIATVVDNDCMSTQAKEDFKYLILRPDCKLYSKWDDKASLIF